MAAWAADEDSMGQRKKAMPVQAAQRLRKQSGRLGRGDPPRHAQNPRIVKNETQKPETKNRQQKTRKNLNPTFN